MKRAPDQPFVLYYAWKRRVESRMVDAHRPDNRNDEGEERFSLPCLELSEDASHQYTRGRTSSGSGIFGAGLPLCRALRTKEGG